MFDVIFGFVMVNLLYIYIYMYMYSNIVFDFIMIVDVKVMNNHVCLMSKHVQQKAEIEDARKTLTGFC